MNGNRSRSWPTRSVLALLAMLTAMVGTAGAVTPEDPVVQEMVTRASKYLESPKGQRDSGYSALGGRMLVAYAHHKANRDPSSPVVKRGVEAAKGFLREVKEMEKFPDHSKDIYEASVAVLLLADVDPISFKSDLSYLQSLLYREQMSAGGWTYQGIRDGDISQTQYALLALWTLDHVGVPLDYERVKTAADWLLRVQDIGGGWPYHADDPGPGRPLKRQSRLTMSMALAGGSSLLIAGDALRAWGETKGGDDPDIEGLPDAVKLFREDQGAQQRRRIQFPKEQIYRSIALCEQYRQNRPYERPSAADWYYYQLYTLERYESFVEISGAADRKSDKSPQWYNEGVEALRTDQDESGGFGLKRGSFSSPPVATAFAILFLIRSTQKAIFTIGRGTLAGGQGLPSDTTEIRVDGTQIKGRPVAAAVTDLLDILEQDAANDLEEKSLPENLQLASEPDARAAQLDRLERLLRGSQSWQARRVAARVLAQSDDVTVVPSLIHALSDPDTTVRRFARDGLRFISRKFEGFDLPNDPSPQQVSDAQADWRRWYRTIDPTHVFLDFDL